MRITHYIKINSKLASDVSSKYRVNESRCNCNAEIAIKSVIFENKFIITEIGE